MIISALAAEFAATRPGVLLDDVQMVGAAVAAARFYAGYGDIRSVSGSDLLQEAAGAGQSRPLPPDEEPAILPALPIKDLGLITGDTDLSTGEWAIIRPLFVLYVDRENAMLLEATRGMGADPFGRSVSEIAQEIAQWETEVIPTKAFVHTAIEV